MRGTSWVTYARHPLAPDDDGPTASRASHSPQLTRALLSSTADDNFSSIVKSVLWGRAVYMVRARRRMIGRRCIGPVWQTRKDSSGARELRQCVVRSKNTVAARPALSSRIPATK